MTTLKALAWENLWHSDTLTALSRLFELMHKDYQLEWSFMDLTCYNDEVFRNKLSGYDLLLMKNRHMATIGPMALLTTLEEVLETEIMEHHWQQIMGRGFSAFSYDGHQYGIPFTSTAFVCGSRKDLLDNLGLPLPNTWEEVINLGKALPEGKKIMLALKEANVFDIFRCILGHFLPGEGCCGKHGIKIGEVEQTLQLLEQLLVLTGPEALSMSMTDLYSEMSAGEAIVYTPMVIGNANYAKDGFRKHLIDFGDIPRYQEVAASSIFFASGIGILRDSHQKAPAKAFLNMVLSKDVQRHMVVDFDGHPIYTQYWKDKSNNQKTNQYFNRVRETVNMAVNLSEHNGYAEEWRFISRLIWGYLKERRVTRQTFAGDLVRILNQYEETIEWH